MSSTRTVQTSQALLRGFGTRLFLHYQNRIPQNTAVLIVSNHRSFLDPILLTAAIGNPIRFACHHYMGEVPLLREIVTTLGAFPLNEPSNHPKYFFQQATQLLQQRQQVGIFPEGAEPMVKYTPGNTVGAFQRGFAHLALRANVENLAVLPVAIAAFEEESISSMIPLRLLSWFDPSEPLFDQSGWHPLVIYRRVNVLIGQPYWITPQRQQDYHGKQAKQAVLELTDYCQTEISQLLQKGCI
ncbi:MAG: lysophospholipid acyltransferase family protein [Microcoleaceae cyanobacterium]